MTAVEGYCWWLLMVVTNRANFMRAVKRQWGLMNKHLVFAIYACC